MAISTRILKSSTCISLGLGTALSCFKCKDRIENPNKHRRGKRKHTNADEPNDCTRPFDDYNKTHRYKSKREHYNKIFDFLEKCNAMDVMYGNVKNEPIDNPSSSQPPPSKYLRSSRQKDLVSPPLIQSNISNYGNNDCFFQNKSLPSNHLFFPLLLAILQIY